MQYVEIASCGATNVVIDAPVPPTATTVGPVVDAPVPPTAATVGPVVDAPPPPIPVPVPVTAPPVDAPPDTATNVGPPPFPDIKLYYTYNVVN